MWKNMKKYVEIILKLPTNGLCDKGFRLTSIFVPMGLSAPALGLSTCIKALKCISGPDVRWAFTGPLVLWSLECVYREQNLRPALVPEAQRIVLLGTVLILETVITYRLCGWCSSISWLINNFRRTLDDVWCFGQWSFWTENHRLVIKYVCGHPPGLLW